MRVLDNELQILPGENLLGVQGGSMSLNLRGVTPLLLIVCFAPAATLVDAQSMQASVSEGTSPATSDTPTTAATGGGNAAQPGSEFALGVGDVIHVTVW